MENFNKDSAPVYIRAWRDGWRMFVAVPGYKLVSLIEQGNLSVFKVKYNNFFKMKPVVETSVSLEKVIAGLVNKMAIWDSCEAYYPKASLLKELGRINAKRDVNNS